MKRFKVEFRYPNIKGDCDYIVEEAVRKPAIRKNLDKATNERVVEFDFTTRLEAKRASYITSKVPRDMKIKYEFKG